MPVDSKRRKAIDSVVSEAEVVGERKVVIRGKADLLPVHRIRIDELAFNKMNGRIRSELFAKEKELGRELSLFGKDDQEIIKRLILSIRDDENEKIKLDLRDKGQTDPGIVTCDGIVINGNRRKALLQELYEQDHDNKYRYLEVHVLPPGMLRDELWLIEAGIQLSAAKQLDYSPINHLLKLRDGRLAGISPAKMAAGIYGMDEEQLKKDLERLDLIDEYLEEYLDKPKSYYLIKDRSQHFINLQDILIWLQHRRGRVKRNWDPTKSDIAELRLVAFHYIRLQFPHMQIRKLRDLFALKSSWQELRTSLDIDTEVDGDLPPVEPEIEESQIDDTDSDAESEAEPEPTTRTEEVHRREEKRWRDQNNNELRRNFENAMEQWHIDRHSSQPVQLARRALRNLEGIDIGSSGFTDPELDSLLGKVISVTNSLRKDFRHGGGKRQGKKRKKAAKKKAAKKKAPRKKASRQGKKKR